MCVCMCVGEKECKCREMQRKRSVSAVREERVRERENIRKKVIYSVKSMPFTKLHWWTFFRFLCQKKKIKKRREERLSLVLCWKLGKMLIRWMGCNIHPFRSRISSESILKANELELCKRERCNEQKHFKTKIDDRNKVCNIVCMRLRKEVLS